MTQQKIIAQGAEAKIILSGNFIIKDRIKKSYRIPELDEKIRKRRTKAETKLLIKASKVINCPIPEDRCDKKFLQLKGERQRGECGKFSAIGGSKNFDKIKMPFVKGKKLSEFLDKFPIEKQKQICKKIGESTAKLHDEDIIHGDLTTSNMILVENTNNKLGFNNLKASEARGMRETQDKLGKVKIQKNNQKIYFIDFGLGYFDGKYEDKAVDLHLLKQALEAKHFKNWEKLWSSVKSGYKKSPNAKKVLERLIAVEKRGRYKH